MTTAIAQLNTFPGNPYQMRTMCAAENYHLWQFAHKLPIGRAFPTPPTVVEYLERAQTLSPFQQAYLKKLGELLVFARTRTTVVELTDYICAKQQPTIGHAVPKQVSTPLQMNAKRKPTLWKASEGAGDLPSPTTFLGDFEILDTLRLHSPAFYALRTPAVFGKWAIDLEVDHLYQTQLRYMSLGGDFDGDQITPYSKPTMLDLNAPKSWIGLNSKKPQR